MTETSGKILSQLASYLRDHRDLALHWQSDPEGQTGYWEIIYVTDHIPFEGDAMASNSLEDLVNKLPK